jgi:Putative Ig domain.
MLPSGTKKCGRVSFLLISIALLITVLPALVSADSNETIVIGNTVVNPGASFSLPIFVENVTNMSSLSMDLIFDPSLLSVDNIVANDTLAGSELIYYINNSSGFANMTLGSVDVTAEEQFHVADILFSALASGYSDIIVENVSLENNTLLYPAPFVFNGSVRVNHLPVIGNINDTVITAGSKLSFLVSATDEDDDVLVYNVEGLPSGYDLNSTNGFFTWIPTLDDVRTYDANFSVSDGFAVDFTHVNITVNELVISDNPPQLEPVGNMSVNENETLSFAITANDPDNNTVKYSALSLPDNSSLQEDNGDFIWVTDFDDAGVYYVEFIASANGLSDSEISVITVSDINRAPKLSNIKSQIVSEGSTLEFRVEASDSDGDELDFQMSGLPTEATLNANTGEFSWSPGYGDDGEHYVEFIVSDGSLSDSETVSITVTNVNRAPVLDSIGNQTLDEGSEISFIISGSDSDLDYLIYSVKDLPSGAVFDNGTCEFSWIPSYSQAGLYSVIFEVSDGMYTDTENVAIVVNDINLPPALSAIGDKTIVEGSPLSFTIFGSDPDSDSLIYSASGVPSGAIFSESTREFIWTPTFDDSGNYNVTFTVSDGSLSASETIEITVNNVNRAPILDSIGNKVVSEGSELSFILSGSDADSDQLTYSASNLPAGASFNLNTHEFSWILGYDDSNTYSVTFSVNDSSLSDSETININVVDVNRAPFIESIPDKLINEDEELIIHINGSDADDDSLDYSKDVGFGTLVGNVFSWTPGYEDSGIYDVNFSVSDGDLSYTETVKIAVGNTNVPPVLGQIGGKSVDENQALSFVINATDIDSGDNLIYDASGLPSGASFDTDAHMFSWTPSYSQAGTHSVVFEVSDGIYADTELVRIVVNNVNRPPVLSAIGDKTVVEGSQLSFTISGSDPDSDSLTYSASGVPSGASFSESTREFIWTPTFDDSGNYEVTFTVSDGSLSDSETITISVGSVNRAPELTPIMDKEVNENSELLFSISGSDPDGDDLTYYATGLPSGAMFDVNTRQFRWTPGYEDSATYDVTFTVSDGSLSDSETIEIAVNNVNRVPVLDSIGNKVASEGSELSFTISGSDADSDKITYSANGLPSGSSFNVNTHKFSWTPTFEDSGVYSVTFTISDGSLSDSETISISVGSVNRAPEMNPIGDKTVSEGSELNFIVTGSDPDSDSLKYSVSNLPSGAEFDTATHEFTWTPDYEDSNTYSVTFTVSDGSLSDSETISINVVHVNRAPMLMVIGSQSVDENKLLTITPVATDDDDDTLYYSLVNPPSGSEIDEATGIFTWKPTYEQDGSYLIRFVVSDGLLEDTEAVTVTVNDINRPPVFDIPELVNVPENTTLVLDLDASDPDGDILEYSKDVSFGTLQENIFSWKPDYEDEGIYDVTFKVNDVEFEVSKTLKINVTNSNSAPVLYSISDILVNELETVTINLTAVDIDDDELEFSKDAEYGNISGNIFTWTPGINDSGFHKILFTVSDGQLSDSKLATIAVGNTNIPPVIVHTRIQEVRENEMLTFTLNASDVDDEMLTYSCAELPAGANIERTNGTFIWTPTYEQAGTYTVELMVSDKIYTAVDAVVINVENVNRAPVFDSIPMHAVNETETLLIHLDASDPDGDGITFSTTAENGKVIGNTFTWTPDYFDSGDYDLDFKVTDGYLTDNTTVHVEVYQTNMPPEIEDMGSYSVYENNTLQFFVDATDGDNDSLTYSVSGLPTGASFNTSTGQFTWKPGYTQSGTYSVEFQVTDGELNASKAVSIRVYDVDLSSDADFSGFETSGSGSSGGGSSSGAEDYDNVAYKDYSMKYVTQGMDIVFEFPNVENDLEYVKFHAVKAAGQVKAIIEILKDRSTLVSSNPPGDVYRNINIWVGDAKFNSAGYMSSAEISFKVEKKWLTDNNADPSSIRLYRYSGGSWNELKTSRIGADAKYYYYKAPTPGFSPFSIVSTGPTPVSVNTAAKSSTVENLQYSYDADTRLESTGSDSDAAVMNTALEPRTARPVDTGIVFIGIIGILAIGSVLGYKSRNESVVLSRYYDALYTVSASVRNAVKWPMNKLSSGSIHKDYAVICGKMKTIRSANYRGLCHKKIAEIKERQKH